MKNMTKYTEIKYIFALSSTAVVVISCKLNGLIIT